MSIINIQNSHTDMLRPWKWNTGLRRKNGGRDGSIGIAIDWAVQGSNPGEARFSAPVQTGPGAHPPSYTMGTECFSLGESGGGVGLTTQPHLAPRLKKE